MWKQLLASLALVGCTAPDVPEVYHGRTGRTVLAVPSAIAGSVLYDGESDWAPPDKRKSERTDRDAIRTIEFFVDLDHPERITTYEVGRELRFENTRTMHLPSIFGHVLGVSVDFPANGQQSSAADRSNVSEGQPAFQALKPAPAEYGLETRRADYSESVKGRNPHGFSILDVDVDYLSRQNNTYIFCNDAHQTEGAQVPMPTCEFNFVVPELGAHISGAFDRGDVSRWRGLRAAVLTTIHSFVVAPPKSLTN